MATIVHFDISADDLERAKNFYEKLFGWSFTKFNGSPQEYLLIETRNAAGEKGITGGMAKREKAYQKITNFIQVDSINKAMADVVKLGGQIMEPKTPIPTIGFIAGCKDTEDNIFGLIELSGDPGSA